MSFHNHQRHSYPAEKSVPKMPGYKRFNKWFCIGYTSIMRQVEKKMHKKKRREYFKKQIREET